MVRIKQTNIIKYDHFCFKIFGGQKLTQRALNWTKLVVFRLKWHFRSISGLNSTKFDKLLNYKTFKFEFDHSSSNLRPKFDQIQIRIRSRILSIFEFT